MEDVVDALLEEEGLGDVVVDEEEVVAVSQVLDVLQRARVEVVDADDAVALRQEVVAKMRPKEAGPAGNDRGGHAIHPGVPVELHNSPFDLDSAPFAASDNGRRAEWPLGFAALASEVNERFKRTHPARKRGAAPPVHQS